MFRGSYEHTVDTKGRLSIPAKYREVLLGKGDDRLIITKWIGSSKKCLDVYPHDEWQALEAKLDQMPRLGQRMEDYYNLHIAGADECVVDTHGRILIQPTLRGWARLKRDVMLVSAGEKFRIWDRETWNEVSAQAEERLMQDPDYFADLGL